MDQRFAVAGVGAFTPLAEAAPALLLNKAEPLFSLEASARGGADMDAVHDMRVASRRLRETMRLLAPLYPGTEFADWYRRVRRVTGALGPVRDSDVFIDDFSKLAAKLGEGGRRTVAFLVGYRMGVREHELIVLNKKLASLDLTKSRRELRKLARSVSGSSQAKRTLADFAHAAVAERSGVVFGALPAALREENMLQQHALRIDFKRLRYAVEVFAPVYGDDFDELHDTLTAFQDTLGDMHDLHLFLDMLREPDRIKAAARAGVSADDIAEVSALLEKRAKERFDAFAQLAAEHDAGELLPALLLPLSRRPEAVGAAESAEAAEIELPAPAEPLTATGSEPAAEGSTLPASVDPAVVLEPAMPVAREGVPQLDPSKPWRSDAAGLAIDPPIIIGAEPWARVAPARTSEADPSTAPDAAPALAPVLESAPDATALAPADREPS